MRIDVLTAPYYFPGETTLINRFFELGLKSLHVRKPESSLSDMRHFLGQIDPSHHQYIIVHEHILLKEEFNLAGIHVKPSIYMQLPKEDYLLSTSAHDLAAFRSLDRENNKIFISPLYDSISKSGYKANEKLWAIAKQPRKGQLIALGGIKADLLPEVEQGGFDGAALLGYLWNSNDPLRQFATIKSFL